MLNPADPRDWAVWIRQTPSALAAVAELIAQAPRMLAPDHYRRWRRLLSAWNSIIRQRYDVTGPDGNRLRIVLENLLADVVGRLGLGASDREIFDTAQGIERHRPQAEQVIEDDGLEAARWRQAEAARNGQGGPNPVRRSQ